MDPNSGLTQELWRATELVFRLDGGAFPARAEAEVSRLVKDRLEVLAKNAKTLRGTLSPNETPWPGQVAGIYLY
jgi:hypothetical protein